MSRTSVTGVLVSALAATLPGCGDDGDSCLLTQCGSGCVDTLADSLNCGMCDNACGTGTACSSGMCLPTANQCTAPEVACGDTCVNTQTDAANCGVCGTACATDIACVTGLCASPLVAARNAVDDGKSFNLTSAFAITDATFASTTLSGDTKIGGDRVIDIKTLPDGRVLLVSAEEASGKFELWLSPAGGGALVKLNPELPLNASVQAGIVVSKDGTRVLYRANQDDVAEVDLYAVALANPGSAVRVNGPLPDDGATFNVFALSDNGNRAVYIAAEDASEGHVFTHPELFTVDLSGAAAGPSVRLNADGGEGFFVGDFQMSGDGSRVVYRGFNGGFSGQLVVVDVANPGVEHLITNPQGPNYHADDEYLLTADGTAVVYLGEGDFNFADSLWIASTVGPVFESTQLVPTTDINDIMRPPLRISADGFAYACKRDPTTGRAGIVRVELANPANAISIIDNSVVDLDVDSFALSPDGKVLALGAFGDGGEGGNVNAGINQTPFTRFTREVHVVDLTTLPATPVRIAVENDKGANGIAEDYFIKNDGRLVFRGDLEINGQTEIFLGHPAAPDTVLKISPDLSTLDSDQVDAIVSF